MTNADFTFPVKRKRTRAEKYTVSPTREEDTGRWLGSLLVSLVVISLFVYAGTFFEPPPSTKTVGPRILKMPEIKTPPPEQEVVEQKPPPEPPKEKPERKKSVRLVDRKSRMTVTQQPKPDQKKPKIGGGPRLQEDQAWRQLVMRQDPKPPRIFVTGGGALQIGSGEGVLTFVVEGMEGEIDALIAQQLELAAACLRWAHSKKITGQVGSNTRLGEGKVWVQYHGTTHLIRVRYDEYGNVTVECSCTSKDLVRITEILLDDFQATYPQTFEESKT